MVIPSPTPMTVEIAKNHKKLLSNGINQSQAPPREAINRPIRNTQFVAI